MNDDAGTMAKGQDLQKFKEKHQLKMITIDDLIEYRKKLEPEIEFKAKVKMPRISEHLICMVFKRHTQMKR